jgi:hypothetical protein
MRPWRAQLEIPAASYRNNIANSKSGSCYLILYGIILLVGQDGMCGGGQSDQQN